MRVLLVDDDDTLVALLTQQLTAQNYVVDRVADGETGWAYASTFDYDLMVLDWMLPQLDGIQLCQRLRQQGYTVPILLLTAKEEQTDKIKGLEAGADDYVVKPFDIAELLARIRVLLRRSHPDSPPLLSWGELCLDPLSCQVTYQAQPVSLTVKEYALLELFLRCSQQVFSASTLLDRIWSSEDFPSEATVRSHIRGLRRKLKSAGADAGLIETVHGHGYRLKSQPVGVVKTSAGTGAVTSDRQARYLEGLTQAWRAHKGELVERWQLLVQIFQMAEGQSNNGGREGLTAQQQSQAQQIAHSLAGTLGTFGFAEGSRLALQIEKRLLQSENALSPAEISQLQTLATTLGHVLDEPPKIACSLDETTQRPSILLIDVNGTAYVQQLMALAVAQGLETNIAASLKVATQLLGLDRNLPDKVFESTTSDSWEARAAGSTAGSAADNSGDSPGDNSGDNSADSRQDSHLPPLPDLVLVNLVAREVDSVLSEAIAQKLLDFMGQLTQRCPQLPVLVITPQADFGNRLDLVRRGGGMVLEYPVVPADVLAQIRDAIALNYRLSKIMIVDDDAHYLQQVMQQLHPWAFQITPLANPQRFWMLFNQILPDLVILDIEMPHINGFELCRVLRSHVRWQQLPIIFLSAHDDCAKRSQAFALGADDYITKNIPTTALATRVLNRLKRYQIGQNWSQASL